MLYRSVVKVFSELLSNVSTCPYYVFTFHMFSIPIVKPAYFRILSVYFLIRILSPEITKFTYIHVQSIFKDYAVWFIVRNGSIGLQLFML